MVSVKSKKIPKRIIIYPLVFGVAASVFGQTQSQLAPDNISNIVEEREQQKTDFQKIKKLCVLRSEDIFYLIRIMDPLFEDRRMVIPVSGKYWNSVDDVVERLENFFRTEGKESMVVRSVAKEHPVIGFVIIENTSKPESSKPEVIRSEIKTVEFAQSVISVEAPKLAEELEQILNELHAKLDCVENKVNDVEQRVNKLERKNIFDDMRLSRVEEAIDSLRKILSPEEPESVLIEKPVAIILAEPPVELPKVDVFEYEYVKEKSVVPVKRGRFSLRATENTTLLEFETWGVVPVIIGVKLNNNSISYSTTLFSFGVGISVSQIQFDASVINTMHERTDTVAYEPILFKDAKYSFTLRNVRLRLRYDIPLGGYWWLEPEVSYSHPISYPYNPEASKASTAASVFYRIVSVTAGTEISRFSEPEITPFVGFSVSF